jgi:hypothetical protein
MRRTRTALSLALALGVVGLMAASAPAQAAWEQMGCAPTAVRSARICLYRSTTDSNMAQGRYINNSALNLQTQGIFFRQDAVGNVGCALATTKAGTTSTCTRTLPKGKYYLGAFTWINGSYLGFTATDTFRFGF